MKQKLEYYRALPYARRAEGIQENDGTHYWVAWIDELSGCKTDGATFAEAMFNLDSAFDDYIEAMLEFGSHIPIPQEFSVTPTVLDIPMGQVSDAIPVFEDVIKAVSTTSIDSYSPQVANLQQWLQDKDTTITKDIPMAMAAG